MVLEVAAKDGSGKILVSEKKDYIHMGVDIDNWQRHGAWQIKEIIDLSIQPLETQKERFELLFPDGTTEVTLEAKLYYYLKGSEKAKTLVDEFTGKVAIDPDGCEQ